MPYRILVTRKVPGHAESTLVEIDQVTDYWEHQILAGNAVMLDEPKAAEKPKAKPPVKGPGPRGQEKLAAPTESDEDPEG